MPRTSYAIAEDRELKGVRFTGRAAVEGGAQPPIPLTLYPLLAWSPGGRHGGDVHTEDGKVGVSAVAAAVSQAPSLDALAERFGTSREHIIQALDYAVEAGSLAAK